MSNYRKLLIAGAAALALTLAGCGGGGDTPTAGDEQTMPDPAVVAAQAAIGAANMAAGMLDSESDDAAVTAAEGLIAAADTAIAALPEGDRAASTAMLAAAREQVSTQRARLTAQAAADDEEAKRLAAEKALQDEKDRQAREAKEAEAKQKAADGKALKAALGSNPRAALTSATLSRTGLLTVPADPDGAGPRSAAAAANLRAGASASSLGDWAGTHYAHTHPGTKVSNSAIVYNNRAAPKSYPIASRYAVEANRPTNAGVYTPGTRMLALGTAADSNIKADKFPSAGETTFTPTAPSNEVLVPGTYQGASGTYRCTGTCTATANSGGISLSDAWVFVHHTGATVSVMDSAYLYFGWWLVKDKDGKPTHASAFTGKVGLFNNDGSDQETALTGVNAISGSATYTGGAAGKFAISDPIHGGDAGHFTADATLNAKFSGTGAGLSGTLDNFMANDESVPWSVSLNNTGTSGSDGSPTNNIGENGAIAAIVDNADTTAVNEAMSTVWSIDGNAAAASGTWSAQMYDEKPGAMPTGDGSNVPTSVTGTFQSHFGSTHSMVGAFGATKDD